MRICDRCGTPMAEDFSIGSNGMRIRKDGLLNQVAVAELKCAVCPVCGKAELYVKDLEKLKVFIEEKEQ